MVVAVTEKSRRLYAKALREIDNAVIDIGEALRYDSETDVRFVKVAIEELKDAAKRVKKRMKDASRD
ncbi:MAG: hypothetical protein QXQ33_00740 [Nitrososphaerota archaeon]